MTLYNSNCAGDGAEPCNISCLTIFQKRLTAFQTYSIWRERRHCLKTVVPLRVSRGRQILMLDIASLTTLFTRFWEGLIASTAFELCLANFRSLGPDDFRQASPSQ